MILESVEHDPLIWPTIEENGVKRTKKYAKLSAAEKIQVDYDMKATNIILQGLPADIYSLNTLAEYMILFGADNRPPMFDKDLYDSWKSRMELYMQNRENGRMILKSVENDPLIRPTIEENRVTKTKIYAELSATKKIQADCDMKATNIILQGDDHIACLNKAMAFITVVASSRVTVQQVHGRQGQSYFGIGYKSIATSSRGNNASGQARDKAMLAETQEARKFLDEEQLAFLADPRVLGGQAVRTIIPNNASFQTEDLDTYDSNCDDISNAKEVLIANISNHGSEVISEVPHSETYLDDMENQRKEIVENVVHIPFATTIPPGMFKLDLKPFPPRLFQNREVHIAYLRNTQEQANILKEISEQAKAKQPLDGELDLTCCPDCTLVSRLWMFETHDRELLSAHKLCQLGTVRFKNDWIARIIGYGDYQLGNVVISRVYYVEGLGHNLFSVGQLWYGDYQLGNVVISRVYYVERLGHNLFSVGQLCNADLEVSFWKNTCFIRSLEGVDLLSGSRDTNMYTVSLNDMLKSFMICLLSKASKTKSWLWHRRLSHLNFDIRIFVGYAPTKKAFRIYNRRTRIITETIHVTFDELIAMASEQFSSGPGLHYMTPATSGTRLVSNLVSQQPCIPPIRDDWDRFFQLMFDEYFNPPTIVVSPVQEAAAPRVKVLADSLVSTLIDQDAPSTSITSSQEHEHSPIISQGCEESPKTPTVHDDPLNESPNKDSTSHESSSNVIPLHTPFEHLGRWTKDHPIANVIGQPIACVQAQKGTLRSQTSTTSMYRAKPTKKHLQAMKQIFRYLNRIINMGLWYSKDTDMSLTAYADADHTGFQDTRRSTLRSAQGSKWLRDWLKCGSTKDRPFNLLYWSCKEVKVRYSFQLSSQNRRDLPKDIPLDSVVVFRYEKRSKSENKGKVPTEMELVLEQTQQGTSYEVSVSAKEFEELKRKVKIKGEKKEAILTLRNKPERFDTSAGNPVKEILLNLNLPDHRSILTDSKVTPTNHGRMTKPYSSPLFIANRFNTGYLKMEVKVIFDEEKLGSS
nr:retrovirus-related Pol polyprotein from transposon TNT 1-94 [Tanacetum cinerariifolium]